MRHIPETGSSPRSQHHFAVSHQSRLRSRVRVLSKALVDLGTMLSLSRSSWTSWKVAGGVAGRLRERPVLGGQHCDRHAWPDVPHRLRRYVASVFVLFQLLVLSLAGSSDLWVPSPDCKASSCSNRYKYKVTSGKSSTGARKSGSFSIQHGNECKVSGPVCTDTVTVAGLKATGQYFSPTDTVFNQFASQALDGILGLAYLRSPACARARSSTRLRRRVPWTAAPSCSSSLNPAPSSPLAGRTAVSTRAPSRSWASRLVDRGRTVHGR